MWLSKLFEKRGSTVDPKHPRDPALAEIFGGGEQTFSRYPVNEDTAMRFSAVYACIRVISETIATLPVRVVETLPNGSTSTVATHPLNELLNLEVNPDMGAMSWRETSLVHDLSWGNQYSQIVTDGRGDVEQLILRQPSQTDVYRDEMGQIQYRFILPSGGTQILPADEVLHVANMGGNGLVGWSPIRNFAEAIGMGLAAERFGASFYGNSARPSAVFKHKNLLSDQAYNRLKKDYQQSYAAGMAHNPLLLEEDADVQLLTMPLNEAQFIEARKFQVNDIARAYRVPPHMIADLEKATFSNIEQQSLDFEKHTIRPWLSRLENQYNRRLIARRDRSRLRVKHNVEGLLRGDIKSRYEAYRAGIMNGWLNADEVRALEDRNPLPDGQGQVYLQPMNMRPAEVTVAQAELADEIAEQDAGRSDEPSEAYRRLLTTTIEGLISRECIHAQRATSDPKAFFARLDDLIGTQRDVMLRRLSDGAAEAIDAHLRESREMLLGASETQPADLKASVERLTANWTTERVSPLVEAILDLEG